jgi:hypothetical protein
MYGPSSPASPTWHCQVAAHQMLKSGPTQSCKGGCRIPYVFVLPDRPMALVMANSKGNTAHIYDHEDTAVKVPGGEPRSQTKYPGVCPAHLRYAFPKVRRSQHTYWGTADCTLAVPRFPCLRQASNDSTRVKSDMPQLQEGLRHGEQCRPERKVPHTDLVQSLWQDSIVFNTRGQSQPSPCLCQVPLRLL